GLFETLRGAASLLFSLNIGLCSITRAEIWAAITGLELAWDAGYWKVMLEMDFRAAGLILTGDGSGGHQYTREVGRFHELVGRDWSFNMRNIYREENCDANSPTLATALA
ncbi:Putative ribonuclease H protein At1g65750, partial [Linum perenne]